MAAGSPVARLWHKLRGDTDEADAAEAERVDAALELEAGARLSVELRLHAEKLRAVANELAEANGIDRRSIDPGQTGAA